MDSTDDDFGDLYADVVLQAKSAINNAPEFTKLDTEPEPVPLPDNNNDNKTQNLKPDTRPEENSSSESTRKASSIAGEGDDESDSEDELKIVLNDEDCKRLPVNAGCGDDDEGEDGTNHVVTDGSELTTTCNCHVYSMPYSLYKYMRSHGSTFPSNLRVNGSAKGDWEDNGFNSGQIASVRAGPFANSVVPQCAYGFSLPWYRTILDINIDSFEDKPWSHPGANISDFFNFGFNEESWKRYCSLLDQRGDHTFIRARFPFYKSSKIDQAYESGFEHEKVGEVARSGDIKHVGSSSKFSDQGERQLELPKGRAIEVEGSMVERQPSMDVRRPRFRDSDVVIQINVQDSAEDFFVSGREEVGPIDGNSSDHDTSTNRNLEQDQKRGVHSCGSSDDELPADAVGRDVKNFDISSAFRRCSTKRSASNQMSLGSNSHGNGKISEQDEYHHQNMNVHTSEGMETSKKGPVGMNTCKSDSGLIEAELSLSDRHHFSPIPSSSGSDSELSKDSVHGDPAKICTLLRKSAPNSGTELQDFVRSDYKNSRRNGFKIKKGDGKCYLGRRSPSEQDWKHQRGRHHSVTDRKIYRESDDYPSLLSNDKYDGKSYLRHGPFKEKWKDCDGVCFSTSVRKIHDNSGPHPCLMSDAEGLYYRNYTSVDCSGQKQRLPDFDYHNTEDFSYYRKTKFSSGYGSKRFGYNHISHHKHPCSTYDQYFRDQMDPCGRKKRDEDYNLERSARVGNEDDMARNWYRCEKGLSVEEKVPLVYGKCGRLALENSSTSKERCTKWRSKSERLQSGNRVVRDGSLPYYQEDDFVLEKYGRPFTNRKGDSLDRTYEGGLPFIGRESKISVQRGRYFDSPGLHVDELRPIEVENGYPGSIDHQVSISWSYREGECYPASGARRHDTASSIDDVYDDKVNERYGRHGRRISDEEHRDSGGFGLYNDIDDPIHLGRRRRSWQPKELRRMDDELIARDQCNECFAEKASFSYEQIVTHERIHAKYESEHDGILTDNAQLAHHRYNLIREGSIAKCVNRSCTVPRCRDTVDFVFGQGKSAGGRPNGKRLMCNGRLEKMELKLANEQTTSEDFHGSERVKAIKTGKLKEERNKTTGNWLNKDQVIEHNEDFDIEGQIIMEKLDMENHLEKKHLSKSTVPTRNVKKRLSCSENACNVSNNVRDYDKRHILETLAKMEKRRERFKDPITFKKEVDKNPDPQADLMVDTVETKQQRPARKRRWGGS